MVLFDNLDIIKWAKAALQLAKLLLPT